MSGLGIGDILTAILTVFTAGVAFGALKVLPDRMKALEEAVKHLPGPEAYKHLRDDVDRHEVGLQQLSRHLGTIERDVARINGRAERDDE